MNSTGGQPARIPRERRIFGAFGADPDKLGLGEPSAMLDQKRVARTPCPFIPTAGRLPPYLAGRKKEQCEIARQLDLLTHGDDVPFSTVIFGPRGNGKTALLEWARRQALARGAEAIGVASSMIATEEAVLQKLSARPWWRGIVEAVSGFGIHLRLDGRRASSIGETLARRLRKGPLLLLIDQAHTLDVGIGQELLQTAQQIYGRGAGLTLMFAGTPDLPSHLEEMNSTFWERCHIMPMSRLDTDASADAVRIPFEAANRSISNEALDQVVQESHGYPFFLQLWGQVLWYAVDRARRTINMDDIMRARPQFEELRNQLYGLRYQELRKRRLVAHAAALAGVFEDREQLAESEVVEAVKASLEREHLPSSPDDIMEVITRLHNFGYIWSPGGDLSNRYFAGIPSLMTFVAKMASS